VTDEKRLHGMMAGPGPAPTYDANGWPDDGLSPGTVLLDSMKVAWQRREDGNWQAIGGRLPLGGLPFAELDRRHDGDLTLIYMPGAIDLPPDELVPPYSAGSAASSSASTSGTGGLAEVDALLARLDAGTAALVTYSQMLREQMEGQRRAAWDSLVESARRQEQVPSDTQAGYTMGWRAAHDLLTGRHLEDHEYEALLAAELDSRSSTDRAKGGGR
jgi:hypothetical protein